jgi:hypothetical protein
LDVQSDGLTLRWQSDEEESYRIRRSVDLKNWETVGQLYNGTGGELLYHESFEVSPNVMFYSIELAP